MDFQVNERRVPLKQKSKLSHEIMGYAHLETWKLRSKKNRHALRQKPKHNNQTYVLKVTNRDGHNDPDNYDDRDMETLSQIQ